MGEEYFLRLGNLNRSPAARLSPDSSPLSAGRGSRPSHLQMPQRSLDSRAGSAERGAEDTLGGHQGALERERRSEEPPISLDLTFHLLREVLEMARAEQLAQQAHSNRKLMEIIGK
ncbi:Crh [Lemmus lemmus]